MSQNILTRVFKSLCNPKAKGRRRRNCWPPFPVAAEVLEPRTLLSSSTLISETFNSPGYQTNGSTHAVDGRLRITDDSFQGGSAWFDQLLTTDRFTASFDFEITDQTGIDWGDGFTFAVVDADQTAKEAIGGIGGSLGYEGLSGFAVEFDTYSNFEHGDPAGVHVGLNAGGSVQSVATSDVLSDFNILDAGPVTAEITYDCGFVTVSLARTNELPTTVLMATVPELHRPNVGRVGFTGATFSAVQSVYVDDVELTPLSGSSVEGVSAPGFDIEVYSTVTDPVGITFDDAGNAYVGRDNTGSGGGHLDVVRIHRIEAGGNSVREYGSAITDPDEVVFDANGVISGVPGAVVVGGRPITAVFPDETISGLFPAQNPAQLNVHPDGRLLFAEQNSTAIFAAAGGSVETLFHLPVSARGVAVGPDGNVYTSAVDEVIRVFSEDGSLVDGNFGASLRSLTFGHGGAFGHDLYTLHEGNLERYDSTGDRSIIGTGFSAGIDVEFGPDGALYVPELANDRVLRITEAAASSGQPLISETFNSPGYQTNGSTHAVDGRLRITDDSFQGGSAWFDQLLTTDRFTASFDFEITDQTGIDWGDGFTFAVVDADQTAKEAIGGIGGSLGYEGLSGFAVEFDTYQSFEHGDPAGVHIGLDVGGSVRSITASPLSFNILDSGRIHTTIAYDRGLMTVSLARPNESPVTVLSATVPEQHRLNLGRVGFTGATFSAVQAVLVDNLAVTAPAVERPGNSSSPVHTPPADIIWVNRGTAATDSDLFNSFFGLNADKARAVVDQAIRDWESAITHFNYDGKDGFGIIGGGDYSITIFVADLFTLRPRDAAVTTPPHYNDAGQPVSAVIQLDDDVSVLDDNGELQDLGWFIDPTPAEHGEFPDIINEYAARGGPTSLDLYSVVLHELGHALGFRSEGLHLTVHEHSGCTSAILPNLRFYHNPRTEICEGHLDPLAHSDDLMNPHLATGTRWLISSTDAIALHRAYDYSVRLSQLTRFSSTTHDGNNASLRAKQHATLASGTGDGVLYYSAKWDTWMTNSPAQLEWLNRSRIPLTMAAETNGTSSIAIDSGAYHSDFVSAPIYYVESNHRTLATTHSVDQPEIDIDSILRYDLPDFLESRVWRTVADILLSF